jgi:hypothetical protein
MQHMADFSKSLCMYNGRGTEVETTPKFGRLRVDLAVAWRLMVDNVRNLYLHLQVSNCLYHKPNGPEVEVGNSRNRDGHRMPSMLRFVALPCSFTIVMSICQFVS